MCDFIMTLKTMRSLLPATARSSTCAAEFSVDGLIALLRLIPDLQAMPDFGECGPSNGLFVPALDHQ
jgi:hypothetical protein